MLAPALATIAAFEVVFFSKHDIALFGFVKILRVQFLFKHRIYSIWVCSKLHHRTFATMKSDQIPFNLPSPLEKLHLQGRDLWIKRDDLIHPIVSGNKWRKLQGFFQILAPGEPITTFGGAYSNHLPAAAFAAKHFGHPITGVVRGEELNADSNGLLTYCAEQGMTLEFISRSAFRSLRESGWTGYKGRVLPEGGAGSHALEGCGEIWNELAHEPDHLVLASGTGTTVSGILAAMPRGCETKVHVVSAVKGAHNERAAVQQLALSKHINLHWEDETHYGGFGKWSPSLLEEAENFEQTTGIPLDPNYNAKVWAYLQRTTLEGKVVWIHTGGVRF